jgi:hypothetical protein
MSKVVEVDLQVNSNVQGSIAELKALKRQLKDTAAGSDEFKKIYNQIDDLEDKIKSSKKASSDWIDSLEQAGGPLGALGGSLNKAKVATQSFGGALKATGIGIIVALVAGLAAAFNDNEKAQKKLQPLLNNLQKIFAGVFAVVEPLFDTLLDLATKALPYVSDAFKVVYSSVTAVFQSLGKLGSAVKKLIGGDFSGAWEDAKGSVTGFSKNFNDAKNRFEKGSKEMTATEKENAAKRAEALEKEQDRKKAAEEKRLEAVKAHNQKLKEERERAAQEEAEFQKGHQEFLNKLDENAFAGKLALGEVQNGTLKEQQIANLSDISNLEVEDGNNSVALQTQFEETKTKVAKINYDQRIAYAQSAANTLNQLSELAGKETAAGKALGIASATINTYVGVSEALKQKSTLPSPFDVVAKVANVATILATGFKAVKAITAVKIPGGGGGGAAPTPISVSGGAVASAPSFNVVGTSGQNQIAQSLGNQAPVKAYVVSNDVTTAQSLDRNIVKTATIGN